MNFKFRPTLLAPGIALGVGLLLSACAAAPLAAGPGTYRVVVATAARPEGGFEVLSTGSKSTLELPSGTFSPDGARLYVTGPDARGVAGITVLDARTGAILERRTLSSARFEAPGVISADGRWLVRSYVDDVLTTHIAVVDTQGLAERDVTLPGIFALDAIDRAGSILYLLETVGQDQYRVRDYDLLGDRLDATVIVDKTDASPVMNGTRISTVATADGEKVFGLYQRPGQPPFIHILWTGSKLAWCVDLPPMAGAVAATGWSLLLDEAHARVYAINAAGAIVEVDYSNLPAILRSESFQPPAPTSWRFPLVTEAAAKGYERLAMSGRPALSADGRTIYVPDRSGYLTIAMGSLHPSGRGSTGRELSSLALSADGKMLFGVRPASNLVLEFDAASGKEVATFKVPYPVGILSAA